MKAGNNNLAIENYQKSIALNPANSNAVDMLAKLGVQTEIPEVKVDENILETYIGT